MQTRVCGVRSIIPEDPKAEETFMFVLSVDLRIKPENVEAFTAKAIENAADSRKEPGCRQFDVLVDPKDRTKLMLYEVYVDDKAFEAHQQTAHFKKYAVAGLYQKMLERSREDLAALD